MSNPLHSCLLSDPRFPSEPAACAAGPPISATPGQYRRDQPRHASEQVPMGPLRGAIFRIWSTETPGPRLAGSAEIASSVAALLSRQATDGGLTHIRIWMPRAPRPLGPNTGQSRRANTAGLRGGQTLATWIALGGADVSSLHSSWRAIRSPDRKAARVLLVCRFSKFVHKGLLARFHELRQ
jgi:hypothetical protein